MRTVFEQACPICGRTLEIRVAYLGRRLTCGHCGGRFVAAESVQTAPPPSSELLARAEALLQKSEQQLSACKGPPGC